MLKVIDNDKAPEEMGCTTGLRVSGVILVWWSDPRVLRGAAEL